MSNRSSVREIQRPEPHILTVYGNHPFYLDPSQKGIWRRGTPFDEDERQLQYLSFTQPFNFDTILRPVHSWDDGNGGIAKNWKSKHCRRKLPDQDSEKKTRSTKNKEPPSAGQPNQTLQVEAGGSGNIIPESGVKIAGPGPVQGQTGSWFMDTIASLSKRTAECPRKKISLAEYKARPRAPQPSQDISGKSISKQDIVKIAGPGPVQGQTGSWLMDTIASLSKKTVECPRKKISLAEYKARPRASQPSQNTSGKSIPKQDIVTAGIDGEKPGAKRSIENVVGSDTKDTTAKGSPYPDAKRARPSPKPEVIPDGDKREPHATINAWPAPVTNGTGNTNTTQNGASTAEKIPAAGGHGEQRFGEGNPSVSATEAPGKTAGSVTEHELRARKRPLEAVTGTDATKAEPAIKKRAIGAGKQSALDNEGVSSKPKILSPSITQPTRAAPENTGNARNLPPLLSPTLPDWVEEEIAKREPAGATAPKSTLTPLWTDQEFQKKVASTPTAIREPQRADEPKTHAAHAPKKNQRLGPAPENTGSSRDLPPLLSPTLPGWIEEEVTKRKAAGATAPKSTLAPLWTDQEFEKKAASTSVAITKRRLSTKQNDTAVEESEAQSKPNQSKGNAAQKASKSNLFIEHLKRCKRFG